jgi:hypothetical protein
MGATNTNVTVVEVAPLGGATLGGYKMGYLVSGAKAAQNDTLTVTNATLVDFVDLQTIADGVADPCTISANVITMTSATATACKGLVFYK